MNRFILLLLVPLMLFAQKSPNTIKVNATSSIYIKANVIKFKIHINDEDKDPKLAYENHKKLENKLLELLKKYEIPDSSVAYSLLNIRKSYDRNKESVSQTRQEVVVTLNSVKDYTNFQIELLENNFNEFNATYSTNNFDGAKERGYKKAIKIAKEDASTIAKAMNKKLGDIVEINTSTADIPQVDTNSPYALVVDSNRDITEIEQSIQIRTNIEVKFKVMDK